MDPADNSELLPKTDQSFAIPQDEDVHADIDLQDDKDKVLQDAYSNETAAETLQIPEAQLKEGLDKIAFDEHDQASSPNSDQEVDDWREHLEDLNENDKR